MPASESFQINLSTLDPIFHDNIVFYHLNYTGKGVKTNFMGQNVKFPTFSQSQQLVRTKKTQITPDPFIFIGIYSAMGIFSYPLPNTFYTTNVFFSDWCFVDLEEDFKRNFWKISSRRVQNCDPTGGGDQIKVKYDMDIDS